ncbi:MAG: RES family NAD+ phosphorylase [Chitinophagaceae bacterium]
MPYVCKYCFSDRELIAFITSQTKFDDCNFCDHKTVECLALEELFDFFKELISNFKKKDDGDTLKSKIQGNWSLFSSLDIAYKVLNNVIDNIETEIKNADERVDFSDEILDNVNYWDKLKNQLIWNNRYLTDINYLTDELGWDGFFGSQIALRKEEKLYRARIHHSSSEPPYTNKSMFCPPKDKATAGRANPIGIPFLYLSDNDKTVLYEIRASYLDEVSIGTFILNAEITNEIFISDFTESITIFHPSMVSERIKSTLLKQKISADLSKPMRRYDSELDYIPTQFICEFIKVYTGVQGIKFRSSLHTVGNNIVIFDQDIMQCIKVVKAKINKVSISI